MRFSRKLSRWVVAHLEVLFCFDGSGRSTKSHEAVRVASWIVLVTSTEEVGALIETDRLLTVERNGFWFRDLLPE